MQSKRPVSLNQPALIPVAGHCDRKPRPLDRDVTTIGRARGTDLCLEANEISTLHCVIYRTAEGFRIRDCNSRCGTRINGESVKTGVLHDADIINLGPFSFEIRIPTAVFPNDGVRIDPLKVEHWKASRRRLAERALQMRKRLTNGSPREQEWAQKGHLLKEKIRCYDQRLSELEAAEKELNEERSQLAQEGERHRQHVQTIEKQLADRLAQADQEIHDRWQEFQKRCKAEEARAVSAGTMMGVRSDTLHDESAQRQQAAVEMNQHLRELEEQYNRRHDQLQRVQQEFITMKEQWVNDQTKVTASLEEQQASLAQKKTELVRMMGELKKMQEDLRRQAQARPDTRALEQEISRLRQENAQLRQNADTQSLQDENNLLREQIRELQEKLGDPLGDPKFEELRVELELLRADLESKDKELNAIAEAGGGDESLRAENDLLKKILEEKDAEANKAPVTANDLERYEAELNEFRRNLENDRVKLNQEVETLRERNKELDEAIREMEMEMSKERAELARERMRLERVREEVKSDSERLQRELQVRDTLGPVQKLRDELTGKQPAKGEKPADRLRGRNPVADGQPSGS